MAISRNIRPSVDGLVWKKLVVNVLAANPSAGDVLTSTAWARVMIQDLMISMGRVSVDDLNNIKQLAEQVVSLGEYHHQLYDYLKSRMTPSPNLTVLVGELVGASFISPRGSLINLAKHPASTVQILGAEKAFSAR